MPIDRIDPNVTRSQHVHRMLLQAIEDLSFVDATVTAASKLPPKLREELSRKLAGVVSVGESVRVWLANGAPQ